MNPKICTTAAIVALTLGGALFASSPAWAQVAGTTTTVGVSVTESTQLALGWSVKKTLLGKAVYNEMGQKVGKVEDLIIAPDRNLSYLIVGAGGFIGIGRHDVAVPVAQIKDQSGRLVMAGATKDMIKALPAFDYTNDSAQRERFIARADQDIADAKAQLGRLEKATLVAAADAKTRLEAQATALKAELKTAEGKLAELKQAAAKRWKEFEAGVTAANARLRKAVDAIKG